MNDIATDMLAADPDLREAARNDGLIAVLRARGGIEGA